MEALESQALDLSFRVPCAGRASGVREMEK